MAVEDSYGLETLTLSISTPNFLDNPTQLLESISSETETITGDRDSRQVVIIDDVEIDRSTLIDEISGASDVLVLSDEVDSIAQISQSLGQYEEIDAVHIISHGDASQLFSGNTEVNNQDLAKYEELLEVGNDLLAEDTNLIFYQDNLASYGEFTFGELSALSIDNADLLDDKAELYIDHGIKKDLSRLDDTNFRAVDSTFEAEDLFDEDYYLANNPEVQDSGDDPYTHYVQSGWLDDLDPHPLFDTSYYLEQDPNLDASVGFNPLQHFAEVGVDEGFNPHPVFAQPEQVFIAQSSGEGIGLGTIWGGIIVGGSLVLDAAKNIWEFVSEESTPILFTPNNGSIPIGTPPFELPPENDAGIYVEFFPGGIRFEDILDGSLFPNPDDSELEFSGVVTTPQESDALDELVNAPFVFPGSEEVVQGSYVLAIEGGYLNETELTALRGAGLSDIEIAQHIELLGDIHLFRGTSEGFPGNPSLERLGVSPASTDPLVSTVFAIESNTIGGNGIVYFGSQQGFGNPTIDVGNVRSNLEREVAVGLKPLDFAEAAPNSISVGRAREILSEMGFDLPSSISKGNATQFLESVPRLSPEQIKEFIQRATSPQRNFTYVVNA